jgi:hypothetical protein
MNLKDATDLTGDKKHTCDICQQFVSKEVYLEWFCNSWIDENGDRQFDDCLRCCN